MAAWQADHGQNAATRWLTLFSRYQVTKADFAVQLTSTTCSTKEYYDYVGSAWYMRR